MNKKEGFTLIELMVTISIMAILSATAMIVYSGVTAKARDTQRIKDLTTIRQALELYRADLHNYPSSLDLINGSITNCTGVSGCTIPSVTYLKQMPQDPMMPGRNYAYSVTSSGFILCARSENGGTAATGCPNSSLFCGSGNLACDMNISSN